MSVIRDKMGGLECLKQGYIFWPASYPPLKFFHVFVDFLLHKGKLMCVSLFSFFFFSLPFFMNFSFKFFPFFQIGGEIARIYPWFKIRKKLNIFKKNHGVPAELVDFPKKIISQSARLSDHKRRVF